MYCRKFLVFLIILSSSICLADKPVLVLFPIEVSQEDAAFESEYGSALQEGLQQRYNVFFGPSVEQELEKEYQKIDCDAERCEQNVAIAFNGELIADAAVKRMGQGYVLKLLIRNVINGKVVESKTHPCENCNGFAVIRQLKAMGAGTLKENNGSESSTLSVNEGNGEGRMAKLRQLYDLGAISKDEYDTLKAKAILEVGGKVYTVGDKGPAGGIVFYVSDGGLHGLEASPEDLGDAVGNYCYPKRIQGAEFSSIGSGHKNTENIYEANCPMPKRMAVDMVKAYSFNGYADWFLPSQEELLAFLSLNLIQSKKNYLSSTVDEFSNAWVVNSTAKAWDNRMGILGSGSKGRIRAVRAF